MRLLTFKQNDRDSNSEIHKNEREATSAIAHAKRDATSEIHAKYKRANV